uniref:Uncharacterized protein n=1 Tax=Ascaris lumbricoides TaxID=6252 RepID=A0A0M3ITM4_ASCLU
MSIPTNGHIHHRLFKRKYDWHTRIASLIQQFISSLIL